jgi:DNA replication protein DnaC
METTENQSLGNAIQHMLHPDITLPAYDHIELSEKEKNDAIREFIGKKSRKYNIAAITIRLTDEEIAEALRLGRRKIVGQLAEIAWSKKLNEPRQFPKYDATTLARMVVESANQHVTKLKGKPTEYQLSTFNRNIIWKLAQYFTEDPGFESIDFNLKKGIALVGPVGCGKTLLMNLFRVNQRQSYKVIGCQAIGFAFARDGFSVIQNHTHPFYNTENKYGHVEYGTCFDDLGADEKRKFYGDRANALGEILEGRYRLDRHYMTHITTNLDGNDIEEFYGLRTRSRIREMFNWIEFDHQAPDMRK